MVYSQPINLTSSVSDTETLQDTVFVLKTQVLISFFKQDIEHL